MVDLHELLHGSLSRNEEGFYSFSTAEGNGVDVTFPFAFVGVGKAYLRESDIHVFLRDSDPTSPTYQSLTEIVEDFAFPTENTITMLTVVDAPTDGSNNIVIRRIMPKDTIFANVETDSIFRKRVLNNSFLQSLYVVHEALDGFLGANESVPVQIADLHDRVEHCLRVNRDDTVDNANLVLPYDRTNKFISFDSEGSIFLVDILSVDPSTVVEEFQELIDGQLVVDFTSVTVTSGSIYLSDSGEDRGRLIRGVDYDVTGERQITLIQSSAGGTKILCVNNEQLGEGNKQGSLTHDFPSISDGDSSSIVVPVTGVLVGDFALGSFSEDIQGLTMTAAVNLVNTVTATLTNNTGSPVDLPSGTVSVKVIHKT